MRNRFKALQAAVCADWGEWQVAREGIACESRDLPAMNDQGEVPMKVDKKLSLLEETSKKKEHPTNCSCQRTDRWSLDGEEFCHFDWMRTYEGITGERYRNTLIICATSVIATNEVWSHRWISWFAYAKEKQSADKRRTQRHTQRFGPHGKDNNRNVCVVSSQNG